MKAFTLKGEALREGIEIKVPSSGAKQAQLLISSNPKLALVPSLNALGGMQNWNGSLDFIQASLQKVAHSGKGPRKFIIGDEQEKSLRALLLIPGVPKGLKYAFPDQKLFHPLTETMLTAESTSLLCECSPGAVIEVTNTCKVLIARFAWGGEAFTSTTKPAPP